MAAAAGGNARTTPASVVAHVQAWRPSVPGLRLSANSDEHSATITASLTGKASFLALDINSGVSFPTVRLLSDGPAAKAFNHDAEAFAYGERPRSVAELLAFAEARVAEILTASESGEPSCTTAAFQGVNGEPAGTRFGPMCQQRANGKTLRQAGRHRITPAAAPPRARPCCHCLAVTRCVRLSCLAAAFMPLQRACRALRAARLWAPMPLQTQLL